jgi:hypothetical protein
MTVETDLKTRVTGRLADLNATGHAVCKRCWEDGDPPYEFEAGEDILVTVGHGETFEGDVGWKIVGLFHQEHADVRDLPADPSSPCAVLEATLEPTGFVRPGGYDDDALTLADVQVLDTAGTDAPTA